MIGSVAATGAGLSAYALTQPPATTSSVSIQAATPGHQMPVTPAEAGLGDLTAADWQLVSASVGKNIGPDASGTIQPLQPLLAYAIQMERQQGDLGSGQSLTVGDLKQMAANQPVAGYVDQINNAIAYLTKHSQAEGSRESFWGAVNITA